MTSCPICKGTVVTKLSSLGKESFCTCCRNILFSSTLNFKFGFDEEGEEVDSSTDSGGNIEQCDKNGLPGWKGPGEKAHCYTYIPGNQESEDTAKSKAMESAYMESREAHVKKMAEPFFTTNPLPELTGVTVDDTGTEVQNLSRINNSPI